MGNRACWLGLCLFILGCQELEIQKESGEPCTRPSQCQEGLVCLAGVCQPCTASSQCEEGLVCLVDVCVEESDADVDSRFEEDPAFELDSFDEY